MSRAPGGTPAQRTMLAALNARPDDECVYTLDQIRKVSRLSNLAPAIPNQDDWQIPDGWVEHFAAVISTRSWWSAGKSQRSPNLMLLFMVAAGYPLLPDYADRVLRKQLCDYIDSLVPREIHHAPEDQREQWMDNLIDEQKSNYLASNNRSAHPLHTKVKLQIDVLKQVRSIRRDYVRRSLSETQRIEAIQNARRYFPSSEQFWISKDVMENNARAIWAAITDPILESQALDDALASNKRDMELQFSNPLQTVLNGAWDDDRPEAIALGLAHDGGIAGKILHRPSTARSKHRNESAEEYEKWGKGFDSWRDQQMTVAAVTSAMVQPPLLAIRDCLELMPTPPGVVWRFRNESEGELTDVRLSPKAHENLFGRFLSVYTRFLWNTTMIHDASLELPQFPQLHGQTVREVER